MNIEIYQLTHDYLNSYLAGLVSHSYMIRAEMIKTDCFGSAWDGDYVLLTLSAQPHYDSANTRFTGGIRFVVQVLGSDDDMRTKGFVGYKEAEQLVGLVVASGNMNHELFTKDEIPWDEIAFHSSTYALEKLCGAPRAKNIAAGVRLC